MTIFWRFLRFGALAWGGPAAQIAMIKQECVDEEGWTDEETFRKTLAVYQVLPGPEAHELCVYFGRLRGGKLGGFAAGLGFMLPGFLLMLALSIAYVEADLEAHLDEIFYGLAAAVGAIVARAVLRLGSTFVTDVPLALIALGAFAATLLWSTNFVLLLLAGGVIYELAINAKRYLPGMRALELSPLALVIVLAGTVTVSLTGQIFLEGLKTGLLTFGGAFTAIPILQETSVDTHHWLTDEQFIDGLAMSGVLPAPMIIFSTFVGYLAGGLPGGITMTVGVFLPAFVFPIFFHKLLVQVAANPRIRAFLLGVSAAVIGLIAAVTIDILQTGIVDVYTALLAVAAFAALQYWHGRLTVVWVVLACGVVGGLLQLTVV